MDADAGYDTTRFHALQAELKRLNDAALSSGLVAPRDGWFETSSSHGRPQKARTKAAGPSNATAGKSTKTSKASATTTGKSKRADARLAPKADSEDASGKAGARRLLKMLGRVAGDDSPPVPGTDFTESGVVRLLAHLRKPRSRKFRFLQRLRRFLTLPVAMGMHTSAGVSVERLQTVSHRLHEIEAFGWTQFKTVRAARRAKRAAPTLKPMAGAVPVPQSEVL